MTGLECRNAKCSKRRRWTKWLLCVFLMLGFMLLADFLRIPDPAILLMIPVVYSVYSGGYLNGLLTGSLVILYNAYFFLFRMDDPAGMYKVLNSVLAIASVIFLIGRLKLREEKNVIEFKRRGDALVRMATTDKLTSASNRHAFFELADTIYQNSRQFGTPISLLFIDIDHFKQINDRYGHGFGDVVLKRLSETLRGCLRTSDVNCRYGGEEFVLLLANADGDMAQRVAQRIMDQVRAIRFAEYPDFRFTVSIGVSSMVPADPPGIDRLIRNADKAMYCAKQSGRDRIAVGQPEQGEDTSKPAAGDADRRIRKDI